MTFEIQARRAIYVYLRNLKNVNQLKKFGQVLYVSEAMNLVELYINEDQVEALVKKLRQYRFVKHIKISPRPDIDPDLENKHDDVFFEDYGDEVSKVEEQN
ncbi:YlbG family protein [Convivina intestini]|uniref:YlbG family protein n=1 Tax=Convivina intestini TaxID=1505726 RepID=UPI00200BA7CB|nr:YlbG family protein [Convivina intestini]CAH1850410.1 hypothetical protein R078131_00085 [Convivina intestini]